MGHSGNFPGGTGAGDAKNFLRAHKAAGPDRRVPGTLKLAIQVHSRTRRLDEIYCRVDVGRTGFSDRHLVSLQSCTLSRTYPEVSKRGEQCNLTTGTAISFWVLA